MAGEGSVLTRPNHIKNLRQKFAGGGAIPSPREAEQGLRATSFAPPGVNKEKEGNGPLGGSSGQH